MDSCPVMDDIASPNAPVWPSLTKNKTDNGRAIPDDWPRADDGSEWDGTCLLELTRRGESPFGAAWSVEAFVGEVEQILQARVVDIARVSRGANHYGLIVRLDGRPDVVARLSRHDVNATGFHGSSFESHLSRFELATYDALQPLARTSLPHARVFGHRPLYHRDPVAPKAVAPPSPPGPLDAPTAEDLCRTVLGRGLFLFEKAPGEGFDYGRWRALSLADKSFLLEQSAQVAATLFHHRLPGEYASGWLTARALGGGRGLEVAPTREFCASLLQASIETALSRLAVHFPNLETEVSGLRRDFEWLVPRVLPRASGGLDDTALYRFVLDHGDFGMHNMTIATDEDNRPRITSVYDWEAAMIVPALLSEPKMVVTADLVVDDEGEPSISRWGDGDNATRMREYMGWSREFYEELFKQAPEYRRVILAGGDARRMWFATRELGKLKDPRARVLGLSEWARRKVAECESVDGRGEA